MRTGSVRGQHGSASESGTLLRSKQPSQLHALVHNLETCKLPETGSLPPAAIQALGRDTRHKVQGYLPRLKAVRLTGMYRMEMTSRSSRRSRSPMRASLPGVMSMAAALMACTAAGAWNVSRLPASSSSDRNMTRPAATAQQRTLRRGTGGGGRGQVGGVGVQLGFLAWRTHH